MTVYNKNSKERLFKKKKKKKLFLRKCYEKLKKKRSKVWLYFANYDAKIICFCLGKIKTWEELRFEDVTYFFPQLPNFATSSYQFILWLYVKLLIEVGNQTFDLY